MKSENKKYQAEIILNGKEFKDYEISNIGRILIPLRNLKGKLVLEGNIKDFFCAGNKLTALDVSKNPNLKMFSCYNNQLKDLDVSNNPKLEWVDCRNNPLKKVIKSKNCKARIYRDEHTKIVEV